jgi:hypothetical protein
VSSESIPAPARVFDPLLFSGVWVATAAASLTLASGRALGATVPAAVPALAFLGTLAVYGVDRLRDLEHDSATAPLRSAFVSRHRAALGVLALAAGAGAAASALAAGPGAFAIAGIVSALGLLHRRLKRLWLLKPFYVTLSWLTVTVGLPAVAATGATHVGWVAAVIGAALHSNVIASNVRDDESLAARVGARFALRVARAIALAGVACAALAPLPVRPLGAVPLAMAAALVRFRSGERYGLGVVDGALIVGAAVALVAGLNP